MKNKICLGLVVAMTFCACSEKADTALKVLHGKAEDKLVEAAGESEVMLEMYRNQYAALKERLIRLKTIQMMMVEKSDQAYTNPDNTKKINMYESQLAVLNEKIPHAENALKEFYQIYQTQKEQVGMVKEELATYKVMGGLTSDMDVYGGCEKRAVIIKDLNNKLKEKLARAKVTLDVNKFEDNFIK